MLTCFQTSVILLSMFLTAMAVDPLTANLTFNPLKQAIGWTASAVPAFNPAVVCWIFLYFLFRFVPFLTRTCFQTPVISSSMFDLDVVLSILGFLWFRYWKWVDWDVPFFGPDEFTLIVLYLLFWLGSCLMRTCSQTSDISPSMILFLTMIADLWTDCAMTASAFGPALVSEIVFSLLFYLIYPPLVKKLAPKTKIGIVLVLFVLNAICCDDCSKNNNCAVGVYGSCCAQGCLDPRCVRLAIADPFKLINNSLPFNKYAFLTTHNAYAIEGKPSYTGVPRVTLPNQEDSVTQQLNNGVRALMLDTYDFEGDIWLCHSHGENCYDITAFEPAIDTMKEIETFLYQNPSEIVTLILEDHVQAPNGLTKLFHDSGLSKYLFPLSNMPLNGQDWPLVSEMVANSQRLIVFTSIKSKQDTEGIAYQWNYMVENQYGDGGILPGICFNRNESSPLSDKSKSLVLVNYFESFPSMIAGPDLGDLIDMLHTCYVAAGDRWANFVAVDYYKRDEEVTFRAVNTLNGKLLCGCDDVHARLDPKLLQEHALLQ